MTPNIDVPAGTHTLRLATLKHSSHHSALDSTADTPHTVIRAATTKDLSFLKSLSAVHSNAVGFLPSAAHSLYVENALVTIALENRDPAGYILCRPRVANAPHIRPIVQAAVAMDAQRRRHGLSLLEDLANAARLSGQTMLECYCRIDLEANEFWRAAGFYAVAQRHAATKRKASCILWRRPLDSSAVQRLQSFAVPHRATGPGGRFVDPADALLPTLEHLTIPGRPIPQPPAFPLRLPMQAVVDPTRQFSHSNKTADR